MWCVCSRTMQPLWSRYNDISSACACIRTGTPDSLYVRTVDSDIVILVIRFFTTLGLLKLLGWLREWEKASRYSHQWYLLRYWTFPIYGIATFPCHHRMRHYFTLPWMWQEDGWGILAKYTRTHWNTAGTDQCTVMLQPCVSPHAEAGTICRYNV